MSKKVSLQVNTGYTERNISGCGMINGHVRVVTAQNIPTLLRKVIRKYGVPLENIELTFQPNPSFAFPNITPELKVLMSRPGSVAEALEDNFTRSFR